MSNYDHVAFADLLKDADLALFDASEEPSIMWDIL